MTTTPCGCVLWDERQKRRRRQRVSTPQTDLQATRVYVFCLNIVGPWACVNTILHYCACNFATNKAQSSGHNPEFRLRGHTAQQLVDQ